MKISKLDMGGKEMSKHFHEDPDRLRADIKRGELYEELGKAKLCDELAELEKEIKKKKKGGKDKKAA